MCVCVGCLCLVPPLPASPPPSGAACLSTPQGFSASITVHSAFAPSPHPSRRMCRTWRSINRPRSVPAASCASVSAISSLLMTSGSCHVLPKTSPMSTMPAPTPSSVRPSALLLLAPSSRGTDEHSAARSTRSLSWALLFKSRACARSPCCSSRSLRICRSPSRAALLLRPRLHAPAAPLSSSPSPLPTPAAPAPSPCPPRSAWCTSPEKRLPGTPCGTWRAPEEHSTSSPCVHVGMCVSSAFIWERPTEGLVCMRAAVQCKRIGASRHVAHCLPGSGRLNAPDKSVMAHRSVACIPFRHSIASTTLWAKNCAKNWAENTSSAGKGERCDHGVPSVLQAKCERVRACESCIRCSSAAGDLQEGFAPRLCSR